MRICLALFALFLSCALFGASKKSGQEALSELRQQVDDLKHELHVLTSERDIVDETVRKQGTTLAELKQKIGAKFEGIKERGPALEKRFDALEKTQTHFLEDLKRLKTQAQELSSAFSETQKELSQLKSDFETNFSHLKKAVDTLIKALQKENRQEAMANGKTYKVKSGDSLEKIAKTQGTTVQELKRLNQLKQDKIIAGQELVVE